MAVVSNALIIHFGELRFASKGWDSPASTLVAASLIMFLYLGVVCPFEGCRL
ncbi:hypothetical protein MS5N3_31120 [Marinobacter salsuginis]|jgi:hypothetical protein|uniref:Uncharacterized protein n=1 Tax=Marinobacter salsuginis TaxID=418719 RepID=A0A5M3PS97_9GAMM|nr:hypothetical protein MS5N3_31120 [Marinobacter salsuginis]